MPQVIPGGRPRSSSDGDILDDELGGTLVVNLKNHDYPGEVKKSFVNSSNTSTSTNNLNTSDDSLDSDSSKLTSRSQSSSSLARKGLTFKSVRKAMSRVFVKDSKLNDSTTKKYDKSSQNGDLSKIWTPDLRYISNKIKGNESSYSATLSTARPLITKSNMGLTFPQWKTVPGTVGINNHGNNCFMNTIIQCLSNTDSFTEYFIRDFFKTDLKNSTNGKKGVFRSSHGEVTEQLAHFLKCLWSGKYSGEVSKDFKSVVGKFNNQYKGDDQNDAQEFLLWLLDCIHEDVSTFSKKKMKPLKTSLGKTDKELASEAASVNGESFILRLFQALHSSTLTCSTCGEHSSTFDPYLCVSLPLPQKCLRVVYVIVIYLDAQDFHGVKMAFTLNQNDGVRELREHIAADTRISLKQLLLVQLKDDCFGATYSDDQLLSDVPENELVYAIETHPDDATMSDSAQEFDSPTSQVLLIHVEITDKSAYRFGSPVMLQVRRDITWKNLQIEILKKMGDSIYEDTFTKTQKLSNLFVLRVYDGRLRKFYLPSDVDMPLYSQVAERAYTKKNDNFGPSHIKIIAEWDPKTKSRFVADDKEHIEISPFISKAQNLSPGQGKVSLEECFRLYTQEEKLIGEDAWLCPHCKRQQQGTIKALSLWSLPEILVLHLKRFRQSGPRRSKLNTLIDFPIDSLDMSSHLSHRSHGHHLKTDDYIYELMGVSNHYGNMMGGHYTAYCRNPIDRKWREYNDTKVQNLDGPVVTKEAYILFYQRRSLSQSVKQRLNNGDHWVYSLPLAPLEKTGETSTLTKSVTPNTGSNRQSQFFRSKSASPSSRRKVWNTNRLPQYSLTPQPVRRAVIPSTNSNILNDDSSPTSSPSLSNGNTIQRSRSKQRQSPEFHSERTHETNSLESSYISNRDSTRVINKRRSPEREHFVDKNVNRSNLRSNLARNQPQTISRKSSVETASSVTENRHDLSHLSNDSSSNHSKTVIHHSPINSLTTKPQASSPQTSDHSGIIQMKQYGGNPSTSSKFHHNIPSLLEAENAGKKLAHIINQDINSRSGSKTNTIEKNHIKTVTTHNNANKDIPRFQQIKKENVKTSLPEPSPSDNSYNFEYSSTSDTKNRSDEFKRNNLQSYSKRFANRGTGHSIQNKNTATDLAQPKFKQRLSDETTDLHKFHKQSDAHSNGGNALLANKWDKQRNRFADDSDIWNTESSSKRDKPVTSKSATISRTQTSKLGIPHSYTDHDIHYSNSIYGPPPSPTPPHGLREEQTFNNSSDTSLLSTSSDYVSSNHLTSRDAHSIHSSQLSRQHSNSNYSSITASTKSQTLPRLLSDSQRKKYNFHPPREVFVAKIEPVRKNSANILSPCVRESSV